MNDEPRTATLRGQSPSGQDFASSMEDGICALRVGDRICVAAPRWMTIEQAERVAHHLRAVQS